MGKPHFDWKKVVALDERMSAYNVRLTNGWAKQLVDIASRSVSLREVALDFVMAMRNVEATARLSYFTVNQPAKFVEGWQRTRDEPAAQQAAKLITTRLNNELIIKDQQLRAQISAKCLELAAQAHKEVQPVNFSAEEAWDEYRTATHFQTGLVGSQHISFVAAYNAYDDLLMRCLRIALGDPDYRKGSDKDFVADFTRAYDASVLDICWANNEVQLFRAARHSFAHAGGRETQELIRLKHPFRVETGLLQFGPHHTAKAFRLVEQCADALVTASINHANF